MAILTELRRKHQDGVVVIFYLQSDLENDLWRARMDAVPRENETVGLIVSGEIPTEYKVESVKWEFLYDGVDIEGETRSAGYAYVGVAVIVSEIE